MALSDLTFTNNLGTVTLTRIMYSITHSYKWDNDGKAKATVAIDANGFLKSSEASLNALHYQIQPGEKEYGEPGTLTLPHGVYNDIKVAEITYENGIWAPWGRVRMTFDDKATDNEGKSDFVITFLHGSKQFKIYNPTISLVPSTIRRGEQAIHGVDGWFRQQLGHEMFRVNVNGNVRMEPCEVPTELIEAMEQRDVEHFAMAQYPKVADLKDFILEAADKLDIRKVIMTDCSLTWYFEEHRGDISLEFTAPPQTVVIGGA